MGEIKSFMVGDFNVLNLFVVVIMLVVMGVFLDCVCVGLSMVVVVFGWM